MAKTYAAMSSEELEGLMIERVNEKDAWIAKWKADHQPLVEAHAAALEREAEQLAAARAAGEEPQAVSPEGIESQEAING